MTNDKTRDGHDPHLAHHFDTPKQQAESSKLGMWLFLSTEILLFGGLFCAYAVYRANHPEIFIYAHQFLDKNLGGLNTLVLITSSFTMAWAVRAAQLGRTKRLVILLTITLLCACGFLGVKAIEYEHKWKHGLLWGKYYDPASNHPAQVHEEPSRELNRDEIGDDDEHVGEANPDLPLLPPAALEPGGLADPLRQPDGHQGMQTEPRNVQLFFGVYFVMTGLHGLHVIAGMIAIGWILLRARREEFGPGYFAPVDSVGLYWHLVDLIWIYLFPLLYLIH